MSKTSKQKIDLSTPLTFRDAMGFPLQNADSRREVLIGALWLLVPVVGWILNMGHRISMVHKMQNGESAWRSWNNYPTLFRHGVITFLGMVEYHAPAVIVDFIAWHYEIWWLHFLAAFLWIIATVAVPGYMSHYCFKFDASEVFNPLKALRRVFEGGRNYWKAWAIALTCLAISFTGLILLGVGFLITSVWFWQVAGFSFATVFTQKFNLKETR